MTPGLDLVARLRTWDGGWSTAASPSPEMDQALNAVSAEVPHEHQGDRNFSDGALDDGARDLLLDRCVAPRSVLGNVCYFRPRSGLNALCG